MPAYVINDIEVTDPATFDEYRRLSPPTVALYGGRFLARGGATQTLEGGWAPQRLVISSSRLSSGRRPGSILPNTRRRGACARLQRVRT